MLQQNIKNIANKLYFVSFKLYCILFQGLFASKGGTVVDDGSHNTNPFGSMYCCGWGWKEREREVNFGSPLRWRESWAEESECHVIHKKLCWCPCFCAEQCPCMHATWKHQIPDLALESFDRVKVWKLSECSGWGRCGMKLVKCYIKRCMKLIPPFTDKQRKRSH